MKELLRYGLILAFICAVASGLLAGVNSLTKPRILNQAEAREMSTLQELFPKANNFELVKSEKELLYYKAYAGRKLIGVAFKAQGKGYAGTIETMVGMKMDGTITAIKILSQNETPGLGSQITEPTFIGQFTHKNIQDLTEVVAITGATISSKAVIDAVRNKTEEIKGLIKDEQ